MKVFAFVDRHKKPSVATRRSCGRTARWRSPSADATLAALKPSRPERHSISCLDRDPAEHPLGDVRRAAGDVGRVVGDILPALLRCTSTADADDWAIALSGTARTVWSPAIGERDSRFGDRLLPPRRDQEDDGHKR